MMKVCYPELRIQKEDDYLLADLNDDDIVNQYDWQIFMDLSFYQGGEEF